MVKTNKKPMNTKLRHLIIIAIMTLIAGNAMAQNDPRFVIMYENHYLAHVNNGGTWTLQDATTFSPDCIWYSGNNYNYYSERATFNPGFVGAEKDPENPFAITRRSPAFSKAGIVEDWMATATDIRGEGFPRLRNGAVNIGCYQCWDVIPGLSVIIR